MPLIVIMLSSVIGFFVGLVDLAFFGASLWQAFVTYFGVSVILSIVTVGTSILVSILNPGSAHDPMTASPATLEDWQDWQAEEEMAADRLETDPEEAGSDAARSDVRTKQRSA